MADNTTVLNTVKGALDGLNTTLSGTTLTETIWDTLQDWSFLLLEFKLIFSALGIIYVGSHAALRRPPSAAPSKPKKSGEKSDHDEDDNHFSQGMELSDAIMFPVMAGFMLVGLYYLIQWLKDPEILNKILRWYMSVMSLLSLLTLYAHGFELTISFLFPNYWRGRDGVLRKIDQKNRAVKKCDDVGNQVEAQGPFISPLPGSFSVLGFSNNTKKAAWGLRGLFTQQWVFKAYVHGIGDVKTTIKFSHMVATLGAFATTIIYTLTSSPFLSNILAYGLCYGSFLVISPTDLAIGSLVLIGLFFYDIVMVFYTPYMVTVATTLDVPIKLTFKAASRRSILGLGDIVLPGIIMAFALRMDLWLHYSRKVRYELTDLKIIQKDAESGQLTTTSATKHKKIKSRYVNVKGTWADRFWTSGCWLFASKQLPAELAESRFRKPYFHATLIGYSLGMAVTLAMLLVFKQGQPALLYLVPGVLGSLYLTAFMRGEMKLVWAYTEDGSIDTVDVVVDLDGDGNMVKEIGKLENGVVDTTGNTDKNKDTDKNKEQGKDTKSVEERSASKHGKDAVPKSKHTRHYVFWVSLEAPSEDA